ncbi:MAG: tetratricopeptide repeat protein [Ottowia sp.]|uniref:O-linked N-acetylglucosamine transferase, SPINDLY family protein n=1 Tax=Ottowia sp. TaxID=1898956 RepID=UPI0039E64311
MPKNPRGGARPPSAASGLFPAPRAAASPAAQLQQAVALLRQGQSGRAETLLRALAQQPAARFDALHLLGLAHLQRKDAAGALRLFEQAAQTRPAPAPLLNNMGIALRELGRPQDALAHYERALAAQPDYTEALVNQGNALRDLRQPEAALASYARALAVQPAHPQALNNRALALRELGRLQEALASAQAALAARPDYAEAQLNLGRLLLDAGRPAEALAAADRALALRPGAADALTARGEALEDLQRPAEALACHDQALRAAPGQPDALAHRASALEALHRLEEAVQAYDDAITAAQPASAALLANAAGLLARLGRHAEAVARYRAALAADPAAPYAAGALLHSRLHLCDWAGHDRDVAAIEDSVAAGRLAATPFHLLGITQRPALLKRGAELFAQDQHPPRPPLALPRAAPLPDGRLRLAYLSADLHDHATAHLMADLFEAHDRARFEVWAYAFGPRTDDAMQQRLRQAFDHFIDARAMSDPAVAAHMARAGIDIAIDLKGYTRDSRPDILAWRPAPVQVSYLGYPGTLGAPYIDAVLADAVLAPPGDEAHYTEQVVRLPGTYQANNAPRPPDAPPPTRAEAGLPEAGFVFCCFNNAWKITPPVFDAWMQALRAVPASVLWLLEDHEAAAGNLRREAAARGVDPARLVFAPRAAHGAHLARQPLADLFLDTLPYGAHTTASDALRQGVPVLTCHGDSFAGRVGASLLTALGLPELVAPDLAAYTDRAIALATQPERLRALRERLAGRVQSSGVFSPEHFRAGYEAALLALFDQKRSSP